MARQPVAEERSRRARLHGHGSTIAAVSAAEAPTELRCTLALLVRTTHLDPADLRTAAAVMLPLAVVLPLLPGHTGLACPLRTLTGVPCPLCGMTTSVEETVRLHLHDALAANPAGVGLVLVAVALLVLRPRRLALPSSIVPVVLAATWIFELHRFGFL